MSTSQFKFASDGEGRPRYAHNTKEARVEEEPEELSVYSPPFAPIILGVFGLIVALAANIWQGVTTFTAFEHILTTSKQFLSLNAAGQAQSSTGINAICFMIAIVAQTGIAFILFRVHRQWKEQRAQGGIAKHDSLKHTAVELVHHARLVLAWGAIAFVADTIGDVAFVNLYTSDVFVLFLYGVFLYAASTVCLTGSLELIWAGRVAWAKFHAWHEALQMAAQRKVGGNA